MPGQYAIGICVSEYRDGVLLSTTMRDFQFNVTLCDPNIQSVVAQQAAEQFCIGETMTLTNNSINASSYAWDFGVPGSTSDVSDEYEPTYTWPEPGDYWVTLIVNPGGHVRTPQRCCIKFGNLWNLKLWSPASI